jgi:hypothetical protein
MKKQTKLPILFILGLALLQVQNSIAQQDSIAIKYASTITVEDLREDLTILASDALEGRETGERGQKMAAAYIRAHFEELGLEGPVKNGLSPYYQYVDLKYYVFNDTYVLINGQKLEMGKNLNYKGAAFNSGEVSTEVVFGGSGSIKELDLIDYNGKSVLIFNENRRQRSAALKHIKENGGKMLFAVTKADQQEFDKTISKSLKRVKKPKIGLTNISNIDQTGIFSIGPNVIASALNIEFSKLESIIEDFKNGKVDELSKMKQITISYNLDFEYTDLSSENVLGYLGGTDLKDELLVITAHYDHNGVEDGLVFNGADDDGSGTSGVLELAEAFALAKANGHGPRRSILFMTVTGEEKGLLGSKYYTDNPVFPLANTVTNLNIDMIGRRGYGKEENNNYIYVIGADKLSTELHDINENANNLYTNLELDYIYNDEKDKNRFYYRSDHYNFANNNIPIIFYFNGTHKDYHKSTDTVEKIEFELMRKRAQLVFYTAWEVANRDDRLVVDKGVKIN